MGQAALPPADTTDNPSARRRFDRKILLLFSVLAASAIGIQSISYLFDEEVTTYGLASLALGGLSIAFFVAGIPVYLRYRKKSLTPRKKLFRRIAVLSIALTVVTLIGIVLGSIYAPDAIVFEKMSTGEVLLTGAFMATTMFITYVVTCYAALVAAMGIVGVMVALERILVPWVLGQAIRLSGINKPSLLGRAIRWLFDIPDVLDTRTLSLSPTEPRKRVSLSDLRTPVLWQLMFGLVLGIYISFNPFVSDRSPEALLSMFSLLAAASTMFPFLILPWFIFRRLGATMTGVKKPFTLYDGIRSRVFKSYFAVGTIVILIRLSFQEIAVAFETYVVAFAAFMVVVLMSALLSTFAYMNYLENDLAEDIIEGARETLAQSAASEPSTPAEIQAESR